MLNRFSNHIRQNVYGLVAIFIALSGTAYATHPGGENTISTDDLQSQAVINQKIALQAVQTGRIADGAVTNAKIAHESITNNRIAPQAVNAGRLADGAVVTRKLADGAVTAPKLGCAGNGPDDEMVKAGSVCIDKYEASLWDAPSGGNQIVGNAAIDAACPDSGQPSGGADCEGFYARSVAGVEPARDVTYFQAQQALANSGKQLPTNAEWQQAVSGTPDVSTDCNVNTGAVQNTGANPNCVSRFGAFDMVGNMEEWVADWDEQAAGCDKYDADFGDDLTCIGRMDGHGENHFPGALVRGGNFNLVNFSEAGPFAASAGFRPSTGFPGFRGAR
jgi:hypothetical protein